MKIIRQKIIRKKNLNEEKETCFFDRHCSNCWSCNSCIQESKEKADPKSEESDDESSDKVDDEEDLSIFEDEI